MTGTPFFARQEHFPLVGSTNDVVAGWLATGEPEVCVASADEQSAGRGREGRTWIAPAGRSLLVSLGFRPRWLAPDRTWQLAAVASLAMAGAAEEAAGLGVGAIRLKWPNDLVVEHDEAAGIGKLAGVLGETAGLGTDDPRAVIGIGVNVDWPRADFPAHLAAAMSSLRDAAGDRPVDRHRLLSGFLAALEVRVRALRTGEFPAGEWQARQVTTGRIVDLVGPDGRRDPVRAVGVDAESGGLVVESTGAPAGRRAPTLHGRSVSTSQARRLVLSGEILHVRLTEPEPTDLATAPATTAIAGRV